MNSTSAVTLLNYFTLVLPGSERFISSPLEVLIFLRFRLINLLNKCRDIHIRLIVCRSNKKFFAAEKLEMFLKKFPDFPHAFLIGGASDIFVTEVADQVQD